MATSLNLCSSIFPVVLGSIGPVFGWRFYVQKDAKILDPKQRAYLEQKIQELRNKLGISKSLELIEIKDMNGGMEALGNTILPGRAGVAVNPELVNSLTEKELEFSLAHELSHIKANDTLFMPIVSGLVGMITTLAMSILFPSSANYFSNSVMIKTGASSFAALIGKAVSIIALCLISQWREECADKSAWAICPKAIQEAASLIFKNLRISAIAYRNSTEGSWFSRLQRKVVITEDGENRLDLFHPSRKARENYLKPVPT